MKAAGVCETFQIGVAVHSSGELGIQLATMLHLGAVLPNLTYAADAHYHHLADDVIEGGLMRYADGRIAVPSGPGPASGWIVTSSPSTPSCTRSWAATPTTATRAAGLVPARPQRPVGRPGRGTGTARLACLL